LTASLSVFFPVFNGQAQIAAQLEKLLEVLPDLTPVFDLVVIDDGSTDATPEVVHELSVRYPQLRLTVHPGRWGQAAAMRSGLSHSSGDWILARSEQGELGLGCLPRLWQAKAGHDAALARSAAEASLGWVPSLPGGRAPAEPCWSLVRRRVLDAWRHEADDDDWLGFVSSRNHRVAELEFRPRRASPVWAAPRAASPGPAGAGASPSASGPERSVAKRPNYLARFKAFALGE
jgi:glycosyltransferase involved in cell wall biosynthesis